MHHIWQLAPAVAGVTLHFGARGGCKVVVSPQFAPAVAGVVPLGSGRGLHRDARHVARRPRRPVHIRQSRHI